MPQQGGMIICQKMIDGKYVASDEFANLKSQIVILNNSDRRTEKKYDIQFKAVFEAIRELMTPLKTKKKRPIGFAPWEKK